jgi:hypothetical protein
MRNLPGIYYPIHVKQNVDTTKYHLKRPDEMTREDMAALQQVFNDPEVNRHRDKEWKKQQPYYQRVREEMLRLQPIRHDIIRKYWHRNKNFQKTRKWILDMADKSEEFPKYLLEEDYIHYKEAIPEIDEFLTELAEKERLELQKSKRMRIGDVKLRIGNKDLDFDAYDQRSTIEKVNIGKLKKEHIK